MQAAWPFLPLTPGLIASVHLLSGLPPPVCAAAAASLCTAALAALGVVYRARTRAAAEAPRASTWLLLCIAAPFGLYWSTGYSEAPYALLALATLLPLALGQTGRAGAACGLLILTRPSGIVFGLPLAAACLARAARARFPANLFALLPGLLALVPLVVWMEYCREATGDPLVFVHAQSGWERHLSNPAAVLLQDTEKALRPGGPHGLLFFVAMALGGLAVSVFEASRRRWAEAVTLAGTVLLALSSGATESMARFVGANPVVLLALADGLDLLRGRGPRAILLLLMLAVELLLLHLWTRGWTGLV